MTTVDCEPFHDLAPELALGLLAGDDRGAALDHVAGCAPCRRRLEALVQVADDLLLLTPSVEPEIGFESRVMARLAGAGAFSLAGRAPEPAGTGPAPAADRASDARATRRAARRWSRPLVGAVAAASLALAGATGLAIGDTRATRSGGGQLSAPSTSAPSTTAPDRLAARTVVVRADGGRSTCQLVAFPVDGAHPARLIINLDEPGDPPSTYQVLAVPADGGPLVPVGQVTVTNGVGTLSAAIPPGTGPVDGVRILESPGTVRYQASFQAV